MAKIDFVVAAWSISVEPVAEIEIHPFHAGTAAVPI